MDFAVLVTETIVRSYEFETEAEALQAMADGNFWNMDSDVVDTQITDAEVVKLD